MFIIYDILLELQFSIATKSCHACMSVCLSVCVFRKMLNFKVQHVGLSYVDVNKTYDYCQDLAILVKKIFSRFGFPHLIFTIQKMNYWEQNVTITIDQGRGANSV